MVSNDTSVAELKDDPTNLDFIIGFFQSLENSTLTAPYDFNSTWLENFTSAAGNINASSSTDTLATSMFSTSTASAGQSTLPSIIGTSLSSSDGSVMGPASQSESASPSPLPIRSTQAQARSEGPSTTITTSPLRSQIGPSTSRNGAASSIVSLKTGADDQRTNNLSRGGGVELDLVRALDKLDMSTASNILLAGAFAAFTVDFLVYPLDTIKTRIQSPDYRRLYTTNGAINRSLFRGLYQGIGSVILATLPSCNPTPPSFRNRPCPFPTLLHHRSYNHTANHSLFTSAGAFFTTYESTKTLFHTLNPTLPTSHTPLLPAPVLHALASSTAELVSCFILTPAEVLKQNAQMVRKPSPSSSPTKAFDAHATRLAFSKFRSDPRQLWRGYTALAARNLPFTAMQFPLF
ncbi:MAG: hypothetical protein Q9184_005501, partial [Pyrenodesmia sp. 2 TL-2023]